LQKPGNHCTSTKLPHLPGFVVLQLANVSDDFRAQTYLMDGAKCAGSDEALMRKVEIISGGPLEIQAHAGQSVGGLLGLPGEGIGRRGRRLLE